MTKLHAMVYITSTEQSASEWDPTRLLCAPAAGPPSPLTGILAYRHGSIMHFLEGQNRRLKEAFAHAESEPSNGSVFVMLMEPVESRELSGWYVAFQNRLGRIDIHPSSCSQEVQFWMDRRSESCSAARELLWDFLSRGRFHFNS